jgi:hypothetical protein
MKDRGNKKGMQGWRGNKEGGILSMVEETRMEDTKDRGKSERGSARMAGNKEGGY